MKQYFLSLIIIGSMLLGACQKRTQIIDIEPTFLKKTVTYDVTVMDTITHKDNGTLSYVRPFLLPDLAKRRTFYTPSYEAEELQIGSQPVVYRIPLPELIYCTKGGVYEYKNCPPQGFGWFSNSYDILFMPFYLSDNKMTYEMPYCDEPRILTILQKETTILVPYGPVKVIVAYIKAKNSNTGNVYYFNPDLGVVKLEQNYSEVTKKAEYIYQLSKVK